MLMRALCQYLKIKVNKLNKNNVKLMTIGDMSGFPDHIRELLTEAQEKTGQNSGLILNLALNYGSRSEIINATKKIIEEVGGGKLSIGSLDEEKFSQYLYTKDLPEPDLLIRTSGEMRISNFMLWQLSYAELYFCEKFWPDFNSDDLEAAVMEYQKRERRFGGIDAHAPTN
jgi:undecaprenyl diphosphate synthase